MSQSPAGWEPPHEREAGRGGDGHGASTGGAPKKEAPGTLPNGDRADAREGSVVDQRAPATDTEREEYVSANGPPGSPKP